MDKPLYFDDRIKHALCTKKAAIIHPGALGDCILSLHIARFLKNVLGFPTIHFIGQTHYTGFFPGRTNINLTKNINSLNLHKLFIEPKDFNVENVPDLSDFFHKYEYIVNFMGNQGDTFEQNLIYTMLTTHNADVRTLRFKPADKSPTHISLDYIEQLVSLNPHIDFHEQKEYFNTDEQIIFPAKSDIELGKKIIKQKTSLNLTNETKLAIIHPGSGGLNKCWHIENYINIAKKLEHSGTETLFLLGPAETERFKPIVIKNIKSNFATLNDLSIVELMQAISNCTLYIGNDSGVSHLAGAMAKNSFVIFGPTSPTHYRPIGPKVSIYQPEIASFTEYIANQVEKLFELIEKSVRIT